MAYASTESEKFEVYVRTFTGKPGAASGGKWLISSNGGNLARWSRDGKELFYVNENKLMAVEIRSGAAFEAGPPKLLFDTHAPNQAYAVTADGRRFIVATQVEQAEARLPITVVLNWQAGLKK
jgi:eukaryotic-like serine/threonine-protein kinase